MQLKFNRPRHSFQIDTKEETNYPNKVYKRRSFCKFRRFTPHKAKLCVIKHNKIVEYYGHNFTKETKISIIDEE